MKILHLINSLELGGAENFLLRFVGVNKNPNVEHIIVCLIENRIENICSKSVLYLNKNNKLHLIDTLSRLKKIVDFEKPVIIQTWLYHSDFIGSLLAKLISRNKLIWNIRHSNVSWTFNKKPLFFLIRLLSLMSYFFPDGIIVNSQEALKSHIGLGYSKKKLFVIENGIDTDKFQFNENGRAIIRKEINANEGDFIVGILARYNPQKDFGTFLAFSEIFINKYPNTKFLMCGNGLENTNIELISLIKKHSLERHVCLLGPRNDVVEILSALDVYVSSSVGESFPNSVAEAMSCQVACVVTDVGASRALVHDRRFIVPAQNPASIFSAVEKIIDMKPDELKNLREFNRKHIIDNYNLNSVYEKYIEYYHSVVDQIS